VLARDGVCVFPGCGRPITEIHHRRHWSNGGRTDLANLDGHCKYHHRLVHERGWSTHRGGDGRLIFRRPDGTILETAPAHVEPSDGRIEAGNSERGVSVSSDTCTPNCYGDPLDLDWVVAGLCVQRERARGATP
jgi:HNH endonuclease